jgi:hypothetical protein
MAKKFEFTLPDDLTLGELDRYEKKVRELLPTENLTDAAFMRSIVAAALAAGFIKSVDPRCPKSEADLDGASAQIVFAIGQAVAKLVAEVKEVSPNS